MWRSLLARFAELAPANRTALWLGAGYGLFARAIFSNWLPKPFFGAAFSAVSLAFLFLVPFGLGYVTIDEREPGAASGWATWIFRPWIACGLLVLALFVLAWEGTICLVIMAPVYFTLASLGGIAAGLAGRRRQTRSRSRLSGVLLLPFAFSPIEHAFPAASEQRWVETDVRIAADAATVFDQIAEVPSIRDDERAPSVFRGIGIPRPSQATLSYRGLGALRDARFVEGIRFRETITRYEPGRALAFTIAVDPSSIGPRVLDEHVRVGGPFFDVDFGEFRIVPQPEGGVVLHLSSRHRITTHFNPYAALWTDAIMRDLQLGICHVIKQRSERRKAR